MQQIKLKIAKAYPNDSGRGIARLDPQTMLALKLSPGDIIEIEGKKVTGAKVWRADRIDWDQGALRVDGFIRQNAGASIGDVVKVQKADVHDAVKVVLAPPEGARIQFGGDAPGMVKKQLLKRPIARGDVMPVMSTMEHPFIGRVVTGQAIPLIAAETVPDGVVLITGETEMILHEKPVSGFESMATGITYEDIGGLSKEIQRVREMIELPMKHPEIFNQLGIEPPKGILLHGPSGTGKTLIAKAVANESGAHFIAIAGPEIMSKYYGESEHRMREIFEEASQNAPAIIFIDELDSIAPKREEVTGEVERRVVAQLLTMMDGLEERGEVVVIGATNRIDAIDPALRRPGRFDREIEIGVPNREERKEILQIHTRGMPLGEDVDIDAMIDKMHGFVGADVSALAKEAAMKTLRRYLPQINLDEEIPKELLESMKVVQKDFDDALKEVEPSAMREALIEIPTNTWEDIGGLEKVRQEILETVEWPLTQPEKFKKMGIHPPKGILLYGPPGTGKTLIAKAVANETAANFISVRGPQLLSKWVGESEKAIRNIFKKAKQVSPSIIFFDEIDAIAPIRGSETNRAVERMVNQLLTEIDGLEVLEDVIIIAATNRPDIIDPALIRSGRFDRMVLLESPSKTGRFEIFKIHTRNTPLSSDVDFEELKEVTEGYTGADIEAVCREAVMLALREDINTEKVEMEHFREALKKVRPSLAENIMDYYERLKDQFKGGRPKEQKSYIGYR
ncbi:MAG: CDC48 family AAA ATPase [Methanosarcinales archaeon]|uniref:CDC48 family AAA ATPase n=1 Tax=Candidatus Ethanoperedens thermophilum TaxID=2766897 RepID=A0A848D8Z7_9EURY|nr:CDC48 family AAA ATPase [Candidatus Ethanoperedens thermophilum]